MSANWGVLLQFVTLASLVPVLQASGYTAAGPPLEEPLPVSFDGAFFRARIYSRLDLHPVVYILSFSFCHLRSTSRYPRCPSLVTRFTVWYTLWMIHDVTTPLEVSRSLEVSLSDENMSEKQDLPSAVVSSDAPPEVPDLPPLTSDQDSFALAVIEYGGNVGAAYREVYGKDVKSPAARGQSLLNLPQVRHRIAELTETVKDASLVSISMHLQELAQIRDIAKMQGQLKVALQAERTRGEVTGLYDRFEHGTRGQNNGPTNIQINLVSKHDINI